MLRGNNSRYNIVNLVRSGLTNSKLIVGIIILVHIILLALSSYAIQTDNKEKSNNLDTWYRFEMSILCLVIILTLWKYKCRITENNVSEHFIYKWVEFVYKLGLYSVIVSGWIIYMRASSSDKNNETKYTLMLVLLLFETFKIIIIPVIMVGMFFTLPLWLPFLANLSSVEGATESDINHLAAQTFNMQGSPTAVGATQSSAFNKTNTQNYNSVSNLGQTTETEECVICMSEYDRGQKIIKLPCNHYFHDECGKRWLRFNKTCPVCRHDITIPHV